MPGVSLKHSNYYLLKFQGYVEMKLKNDQKQAFCEKHPMGYILIQFFLTLKARIFARIANQNSTYLLLFNTKHKKL